MRTEISQNRQFKNLTREDVHFNLEESVENCAPRLIIKKATTMSFIYVLKRVNYPGQVVIQNEEKSYTCGRGKENEIVCPSMLVSRQHCIFIIHSDGLYIRDLNSSNGVYVNGEKIRKATKLNKDDKVGIGIPSLIPQDQNSFVYSLQIQVNNGVEERLVDDTTAQAAAKTDAPSLQENQKVLEKMQPIKVSENIRTLKTGESRLNSAGREVENPAPSTSCISTSIGIPLIKPDPDDDIEILEVFANDNQSGQITTTEKPVGISKLNNPEVQPSDVAGKLNDRKTVEIRTEVNLQQNKKRTDVVSKSDNEYSEVSDNLLKPQKKILHNPTETINEGIKSLELETRLTKDYKVQITNITTLNSNGLINLKNFKRNDEKSLSKKIKADCSRKSCSVEENKDLYNKNNCTENPLRVTLIHCDKEIKQNNNLANGQISTLNNIKIKEESSTVNTSINKDKTLELNSLNKLQEKVNEVLKLKHNADVSPDLLNDHKPTHCDKAGSNKTSSNINTSKKPVNSTETCYQSDDEIFVVNEIENNGNSNYLVPSIDEIKQSSDPNVPEASTSTAVELNVVKKEPVTDYSQLDVVYVSSDEDNEDAFPSSQLFTSTSETHDIKKEPSDECENEQQQSQEEKEIIVLSDSDDEDNPWFARLINSQVYRPSQDCIKTEPEEVNQTIETDEFKRRSLSAYEDKKDDKSIELKKNHVSEIEEQDDHVRNESVQPQTIESKDVRPLEKQSSSNNFAESEKKILKYGFEKLHNRPLRRSRSDQEVEKQPKKKIRKVDSVHSERKEDSFLDEKVEKNFVFGASSLENVLLSLRAFEDSIGKRKELKNERKDRNLQTRKEKRHDYSRKARRLDDRRKSSSEDRGRQDFTDGQRGLRKSHETHEEKDEDVREKKWESDKSQERKSNYENSVERNKENEEKRTGQKQDEFQTRKKKREEEGGRGEKEEVKERQIKEEEEDVFRDRKMSSEDDKRIYENESRKRIYENESRKRRIADEVPKRFFEDGLLKTKKFDKEIGKFTEKIKDVTCQKSYSIPKIQQRNVSDILPTSRFTDNIEEPLRPSEEPPYISKPIESESKRSKSWDSTLQNIDEKVYSAKTKQVAKRGPQIIQAPYMPKGEKRGISVSVYRSINDYSEASISFEEDIRNVSVKSSGRRKSTTKYHKDEEMKEIRKKKLKKLTERKPSSEENSTTENSRPKSKPIAKVTRKSRQDTLISEHQKLSTIKPGIAHQRMNGMQPASYCPKGTVALVKPQRDKVPRQDNLIEDKTEVESSYKDKPTNSSFEEQEQEEMLQDLVSSEFQKFVSKKHEINSFDNDTNDDFKLTHDISKNSITKKPRKSCLASNSLIDSKVSVKRRVHWDLSNNEIHEFEIDENHSLKRIVGKDAPIIRQKPKFESKIDEYLSRIFYWNPTWLEEQKNVSHEPPVYQNDVLRPMKNHYASFSDYCNILRPLLLLEIWNALSKESETEEKKHKFRMFYCSVVANSVSKTKTSGGELQKTFLLEFLMSREEFKKDLYPGPGHLIILEYPYIQVKKNNEGNVIGKSCFQRVFAYVESKYQTPIIDKTRYNRDLKRHTRDPEMLVTFSVLTRSSTDPPTDKICRMRGVMYLKSNMREILALQNLPTSPLKRLILTPTIKDFQLPKLHPRELNSLITKDTLNKKQLEAVVRVSDAAQSENPLISLIHGPPGTGKSKVIVNIVAQVLSKNPKTQILVCAPSNAAVDELVLRLLQIRSELKLKNIKMVRVGRVEAMNPRVTNVSLIELSKRQIEKDYTLTKEEEQFQKHCKDKIQKLESHISLTEQRMEEIKMNVRKGDIKNLSKQRQSFLSECELLRLKMSNQVDLKKLKPVEVHKIHRDMEELMLSKASVIACTLSSCYSGMMEKIFGGSKGLKIPICIVDEATQCCETENLIPLMLGVKKLILVGDTNQLPATILSKKAKEMGLHQSLFARIQKTFEDEEENPIILLDVQYRMDYPILSWPNSYFYQGKLKDEARVKDVPYSSYRVLNLNSYQDQSKFSNTVEADFVSKIIYIMVASVDVSTFSESLKIGVITPYQNQRNVILPKINERLGTLPSSQTKKFVIEVNTVDSFQGQERDVVIMSCVRSSGIGFMSDKQRLCVALTRAKSSLILCGNFRTFQKDDMWNELLTNAKNRGIFIDVQANADLEEIRRHILR